MRWALAIFLLFALFALWDRRVIAQEETEGEAGTGEEAEEVPSKLLEAAAAGDVDGIKAALAEGASIDTTNVNGWSAASFAVSAGKYEALQALIEAEIDLNQANNEGMTPLMYAALQGDKEIVELLLTHNADPSIATPSGMTAYSVAMEGGRKVVSLLIAESCVLRGIYNEDRELILESVKRGAYVNIPTPGGWTALVYAATTGDYELASELLALNADVNRADSDGWTPLHFAAHNNRVDLVDLFLKADANPVYLNNAGQTAKELAKAEGHTEVEKMIPDADSLGEL
jgi:ankyrin repeat protein